MWKNKRNNKMEEEVYFSITGGFLPQEYRVPRRFEAYTVKLPERIAEFTSKIQFDEHSAGDFFDDEIDFETELAIEDLKRQFKERLKEKGLIKESQKIEKDALIRDNRDLMKRLVDRSLLEGFEREEYCDN
jgi:hypothetical protein